MSAIDRNRTKPILRKPSVDDILNDITAFVASESLEEQFNQKLKQRKILVEALKKLSKTKDITENELIPLIISDDEFINVIISILGMSQEEFYRVITLTRVLEGSFNSEWKMNTIVNQARKNENFATKLATLLLHGKDDKQLAKHIPRFSLNKLDKDKLLLDLDALLDSLIRTGLKGAYDEAKGDIVEDWVAKILDELRVAYIHDVIVPNLDRKMDFVIPNLKNPIILCEVGVFVTTARELSEKGLVEMRIKGQVDEHYPGSFLVRIIDGIGWLARGGKALPMVIDASDYVLTLNQIDKLRDIVKAHVPKKYFSATLAEFQEK